MKKYFGSLVLGSMVFATVALATSSGVLLPVSDGSFSQWTPSTGSTHYNLVDESACNGTTDYVSTNTVGNRDSYGINLSSIPNGAVITEVKIKPCASKNKTGGSSSVLKVFYAHNGTSSSDAGNYNLTGTTPVDLAVTTFGGLSLTKSSSTAMQVGAVLSSGTRGARLSRIEATLTYEMPETVPNSPSNLFASVSTSGTSTLISLVSLTWTDNSNNETGFKVNRSLNGTDFTLIGTTASNTTNFDDVVSTGTYYYRVEAYNSVGDSAPSNTETVIAP